MTATAQTTANMTTKQDPSVIGFSEIQPKAPCTMPFRFVLRFLGAEMVTPYVVHMETLNEDGTHNGYHNGTYCGNMLEGYEALKARAAKERLGVRDANGKRIPSSKL